MKHNFNLLLLKNIPIFDQLQIEEALLRLNDQNWCIINQGSPPSIVMGIATKPQESIDVEKWSKKPIPLIKRYSGGGTVVVDRNTFFVSFIFQKEIHNFPSFPEPILRWSARLYKTAFSHPCFALRENDYVIGNLKCGGNAQYITKDRFVHHTTFLWDFEDHLMDYLLYPKKTPTYRQGRTHIQFLCKLREIFPSKEDFFNHIIQAFSKNFNLVTISLKSLFPLINQPHRKTTLSLSRDLFVSLYKKD